MAFPLTNAHFAEKNLKYDKKRGSFEAITKHFYSSIKLYQDKINQYPRQASHAHGQYTRLHQFRQTFTAVNPIIIAIFSILKASYHPNQLIHIKEIFRAIFFFHSLKAYLVHGCLFLTLITDESLPRILHTLQKFSASFANNK